MKKAFLVTLLLFWASFAHGQKDGIRSFTASDTHEFDTINLMNLVPSLNIPVISKSAGALPGNIALESSQACKIYFNPNDSKKYWTCGQTNSNPLAIIYTIPETMIGMTANIGSSVNGSCTTYTVDGLFGIDNLSFYDTSAVNVFFPSTCGVTSATSTTTDDSGFTFTITATASGASITSLSNASGWTVSNSSGTYTVTDPFGNTLTYSGAGGSFTDSLGASTTLGGTSGSQPTSFAYKDTSGTTQNVTFTLGTASTFVPRWASSCVTGSSGQSVTPITAVNYPDGTSVGLGWETNGGGLSGVINSITLRTGGTISYVYTLPASQCTTQYYSALTRTTPDGTTNYSLTINGGVTTTTVLDPGKNKVVYVFLSTGGEPVLTSVSNYQNTGTVMVPSYTEISSTTYCYNNMTCPATLAPSYPITQRDVYQYTYKPDATQVAMSHDTQLYDSYGNITSDANTDSINSQTITTTTVYGTLSSGTCSNITNTAIHNHPCTVITKNGSTWLSESTYSYNANGALTSSSACLSSTCTGSSALTTTYTPTTHGTYSAIQDPNGQTVNYTYGSCNSLMPTDVTTTINSIAIDHKATWNCDAGVTTDTTDANSNEDDTTYDSMNRIHTYHDRMGDTNTTTYDYGTPTLDHVKVTDNIGVVSYQYNDGLGRPTNSQVCETSGCTTLDTSSTSYAWNGVNFETKTYVPCTQTTLNTACTTVAVTADVNPMGPYTTTDANSGTGAFAVNSKDFSFTAGPHPSQENNKIVQTEVDGFGRTTSVCALENTGGTSCGQTMGNSGILTSNTYSFDSMTGAPKVVSTRGSQTHTTIADAIGRPTSIATPEAGTTTLAYDTAPAGYCATGSLSYSEAGDLATITDAALNHICPYHDTLHRLVAYGNNHQSATNPCRRMVYDATANGYFTAPSGYPASANIIGRMVEAETDDCSAFPPTSTSMISDEWFAYDKMGRMTDMWELTPKSSSAYRHTTVAYDADGVITSLSGIPSVTALTYTLDGEERWNIAKQGTTTLISGVTYDAASRATEIDIGAGTDKDNYSFDSVGNMKEYKFTVGSNNNDGVLTWSNIGSLRQLAIVDGLNTNNTQTCKFGTSTTAGYDDVGRILDDDCGTVWAQTYSYDQYDNLTKAGSLSWNPGYSATNNEYQNGATYDSDGNLTKDATGGNTYTWTVYGQMASENSTNATYDALGNMIVFGSYEYLYSPLGKLGVLSSGSPYIMAIPAPGGAKLDLRASANYIYHYDWIGSARTASSIPTSGNGVLSWSKSFSPYGDVYNTGTDVNDRFAGIDGDTFDGLTYTAPNRGLAHNASRWLSPDPAHSGWNAYAYVTDPNTQTDPSGLGPQEGQVKVIPFPDCRPDNPCIETPLPTQPAIPPADDPKRRPTVDINAYLAPGVEPALKGMTHDQAIAYGYPHGANSCWGDWCGWDWVSTISNRYGYSRKEILETYLGFTVMPLGSFEAGDAGFVDILSPEDIPNKTAREAVIGYRDAPLNHLLRIPANAKGQCNAECISMLGSRYGRAADLLGELKMHSFVVDDLTRNPFPELYNIENGFRNHSILVTPNGIFIDYTAAQYGWEGAFPLIFRPKYPVDF